MKSQFLVSVILIITLGFSSNLSKVSNPNLYRNKANAFSIIFPNGWTQRSGQTPHTVVVSENLEGESIIIQIRQLPENKTLEDFSDRELHDVIRDMLNGLKLNMYPDAVMEDSGTTYIANKKAIWMLLTYTVRHAFTTAKVRSMFYMVFHDGKMFSIICSSQSDRYKQFEGIFLNSVRSFIFEDPSWY